MSKYLHKSTSQTFSQNAYQLEEPNLMLQKLKKTLIIFVGEMLGTAILMFCGCLCTVKHESDENTFTGALGFGFSLSIAITILSCVTGGHINPAVTIAAAVYGLISYRMIFIYVPAQILGSLIGFGMLISSMPAQLYSDKMNEGFCLTLPSAEMSIFNVICCEVLLTMVMILVCCAQWDPRNAKYQDSAGPLVMGITVAFLIIAGRSLSGASMNPARSLGPAVWNSRLEYQWIYWVAPLSSAVLTTVVYRIVFRDNAEI